MSHEVGLQHEGDVGSHGLEVTVNLDGGYTVETQGSKFIHADISPFVFHESSDIAKGIV